MVFGKTDVRFSKFLDLEFKSSGQTDFDKRILRNLLLNISNENEFFFMFKIVSDNSQISRFRFAQEENEIEKKHGENDSEYNLLYKSIQSQMNISPSVFNSILDGNNKNKFLETIQNLINGIYFLTFDSKNTQSLSRP